MRISYCCVFPTGTIRCRLGYNNYCNNEDKVQKRPQLGPAAVSAAVT